METLDGIFSKARDVANDVGKKVNDVVEVSKLKLSVVSLGSDIDKVYQKLGLMVYEMKKSGSENRDLVDGCVAEIDALKQKLDEVNKKVDELRSVHRCESCGSVVDLAAQFCPMCGSLVQHPAPAEPRPGEPIDVEFTEVSAEDEKAEPGNAKDGEPAVSGVEGELKETLSDLENEVKKTASEIGDEIKEATDEPGK